MGTGPAGDAARLHTERSGSGLGLSVVRSIASAHGATATARPRPGGGLVATVGFPGG
ncbi:ATP-binding protein [Nocardiopsis tropica]|uniref:ATP-binding protein n=1 Tax=Nocardiopsis tropica TaxID=109330 RepID=UPI00337BAC4C